MKPTESMPPTPDQTNETKAVTDNVPALANDEDAEVLQSISRDASPQPCQPPSIRRRSGSRGRRLERSVFLSSLLNQTTGPTMPQDEAISRLSSPSSRQASTPASLDSLALNFGGASSSSSEDRRTSSSGNSTSIESPANSSSGLSATRRGKWPFTSAAVPLASWPFVRHKVEADEVAEPTRSLAQQHPVASRAVRVDDQQQSQHALPLLTRNSPPMAPARPGLISFSTFPLSSRVAGAVEQDTVVSPRALEEDASLAEVSVTFTTTVDTLVSSLNQAMLERSATTLEPQDARGLIRHRLVTRRASV